MMNNAAAERDELLAKIVTSLELVADAVRDLQKRMTEVERVVLALSEADALTPEAYDKLDRLIDENL